MVLGAEAQTPLRRKMTTAEWALLGRGKELRNVEFGMEYQANPFKVANGGSVSEVVSCVQAVCDPRGHDLRG